MNVSNHDALVEASSGKDHSASTTTTSSLYHRQGPSLLYTHRVAEYQQDDHEDDDPSSSSWCAGSLTQQQQQSYGVDTNNSTSSSFDPILIKPTTAVARVSSSSTSTTSHMSSFTTTASISSQAPQGSAWHVTTSLSAGAAVWNGTRGSGDHNHTVNNIWAQHSSTSIPTSPRTSATQQPYGPPQDNNNNKVNDTPESRSSSLSTAASSTTGSPGVGTTRPLLQHMSSGSLAGNLNNSNSNIRGTIIGDEEQEHRLSPNQQRPVRANNNHKHDDEAVLASLEELSIQVPTTAGAALAGPSNPGSHNKNVPQSLNPSSRSYYSSSVIKPMSHQQTLYSSYPGQSTQQHQQLPPPPGTSSYYDPHTFGMVPSLGYSQSQESQQSLHSNSHYASYNNSSHQPQSFYPGSSSVASAASSSIPGLLPASSGSTGGYTYASSSTTGWGSNMRHNPGGLKTETVEVPSSLATALRLNSTSSSSSLSHPHPTNNTPMMPPPPPGLFGPPTDPSDYGGGSDPWSLTGVAESLSNDSQTGDGSESYGSRRGSRRGNRSRRGRYGKARPSNGQPSFHHDQNANNMNIANNDSLLGLSTVPSLDRSVSAPQTSSRDSLASSEAILQLLGPSDSNGPMALSKNRPSLNTIADPLDISSSSHYYQQNCLEDASSTHGTDSFPILPQQPPIMEEFSFLDDDGDGGQGDEEEDIQFDDSECPFGDDDSLDDSGPSNPYGLPNSSSPRSKKREWLLRMNRRLNEIPVGELDPSAIPVTAIMNSWAKTKSAQGASMVEMWLKRVLREMEAGNKRVAPTTKMYTMAVDAWAGSGEGGAAAQRAEALLQEMYNLYRSGGHDSLRPSTGVFNAVIKAWANSREKIAPTRAEQILDWMETLKDLDVQPDKFTLNTTMHAYARAGGPEASKKAQALLAKMHTLYRNGNVLAKPDTISYNIVLNSIAKSGGNGAAEAAERLLAKMHSLHGMGDPDVKPNVVSYGAVIDCFSKCGEPDAASRADNLLASMIQLHQSDPVRNADLLPNTYVFNCCLNCWAKSKEADAASKAEEMLVAMSRLYSSGMESVKPDAFSYTACIDAWSKSGYRGAAVRAEQLLDKMESKYLAGDTDLKPNTYTYNAVISALAKSGESGAAARAERVLQNMVNRQRNGEGDAVKPTTINFNSILDAWAKSGGGRAAAERAEEILEWMDRLHKGGNKDVKPDTISFNAIIDAWARSGDRVAPRRAEQILDHMDELYRAGNKGVKPDTYTYNTLINCWAKSGERGAAARAEHVLAIMEKRHRDGDRDFKPNTRTLTSVIDAHAKSGEKGAARRAEQILNGMISRYETTGDPDSRPNVHTANAVCNACAFSKNIEDRAEALQIAFRVYDWLSTQQDMKPDSYTYTILLSVCSNLLPREDTASRFAHARAFFESCRDAGYVNDYVLRKLRQTVTDDEYLALVDYRTDPSAAGMPRSWTRNAKLNVRPKNRGRGGGGPYSQRRRSNR